MQSKISKYTINYFNKEEFHSLKREIFTNNSYFFECNKRSPIILDVGAYIGLSILYFKNIYPNSEIVAFEPNPLAVEKLKENIFINNIDGVKVHEIAISNRNGLREMYIDNTGMDRFSVGSFQKGGWDKSVKSKKILVKTEKLEKFLNREIDILKLDVEGSEQEILYGIKRKFNKIKNIVLEYHPTDNQDIRKVLDLLKTKYTIEVLDEGKIITKNIPKNRLLTIRAIYKN